MANKILRFEKKEDWVTKETYYEIKYEKNGNLYKKGFIFKNGGFYQVEYDDKEIHFEKTLKEAKLFAQICRANELMAEWKNAN